MLLDIKKIGQNYHVSTTEYIHICMCMYIRIYILADTDRVSGSASEGLASFYLHDGCKSNSLTLGE